MTDNRFSLSEEYEKTVLEAAFAELLTQECDEQEAQPLSPEEQELLVHADDACGRQLKLISRGVMWQRGIRRTVANVAKVLQYASLFIAFVSVSFGTAFAVSPELRRKVIDLIEDVTPEFVRIGFEESARTAAVPAGWMADYYPGYVPEGYKVSSITTMNLYSQISYSNNTGDSISVVISKENCITDIDARSAMTEAVVLSFGETYLIENDKHSTLVWQEEEAYITIRADNLVTAIMVAEGIEYIGGE